MPIDLAELLDPAHTAVLTMELQRGVVGDRAVIGALAEVVADRGGVDHAARVAAAGRHRQGPSAPARGDPRRGPGTRPRGGALRRRRRPPARADPVPRNGPRP